MNMSKIIWNKIICSECEEVIRDCDNCGERFNEGDYIICYDVGVACVHFCSEECFNEYVEGDKTYAKAIKGW